MPCDAAGLLSRAALPPLLSLAARADALLIGCGLGRSDEVTEIVTALIEQAACQIILDADGINALAAHKDVLQRAARPVVLTPHASEFARLSGVKNASPEFLVQFAQENRCVLLYKGHRTLIAAPDGALYRNHSGNPGMAKGGCGDVLAGMLTRAVRTGDPGCAGGVRRRVAARPRGRPCRKHAERIRHDAERYARPAAAGAQTLQFKGVVT